jgi:membrane protein implicated in regulation of membrane protease activity
LPGTDTVSGVDTGTLVFLVIGGIGVAVLAIGLIGGEILHFGHPDVDGPVSVEVVAGFAGAFGFASAIVNEVSGGDVPLVAAGLGALTAVPVAWLAARLARAARGMRTDPTPTRADLVGTTGVVVTRIPADGYGEVRVHLAGAPVKLNARADRPVPTGAQVFVVDTLSETSVVVETY